jgi:calcineurin-like phosphoesterase
MNAAVIGTHTHVQTADEQIIDGCAFISDVGMSGSFKSIIGRDIDEVLERLMVILLHVLLLVKMKHKFVLLLLI